jgi:hypothetical protein
MGPDWGKGAVAATIGLVFSCAPAAASATTVTFTQPGVTTYTVPAGVTSISASAVGMAGGPGALTLYPNGFAPASGGDGGTAAGTVAVTPAETLQIVVGAVTTTALTLPYAGGAPNGGGGSALSACASAACLAAPTPLLIAAGGGGGGRCGLDLSDTCASAGGTGGPAASPGGDGADNTEETGCTAGGGRGGQPGGPAGPGPGGAGGSGSAQPTGSVTPGTAGANGSGSIGGAGASGGGGGLFGGGSGATAPRSRASPAINHGRERVVVAAAARRWRRPEDRQWSRRRVPRRR